MRVARLLLKLFLLLAVSPISGMPWSKVSVPGAMCGNGEQYHVFVRQFSGSQLAIGLEGGGACWDKTTCYDEVTATTNLKPQQEFAAKDGLFSLDKSINPLSQFSQVFVPYCTGDVHAGDHVADYDGALAHHVGKANFRKALTHLESEGLINPQRIREIVLWGESAGAIGAILNVRIVDDFFPEKARRILVSDSPGLHFGRNFFDKFSIDLRDDFGQSLDEIGMKLPIGSGHMAGDLDKFCDTFSHWDIAIIQASQDLVMSIVFGGISPWLHHRRAMGPEGLLKKAAVADNCSAYVPFLRDHTFLKKAQQMRKSIAGKSIGSFVKDVVSQGKTQNHVGKAVILDMQQYRDSL